MQQSLCHVCKTIDFHQALQDALVLWNRTSFKHHRSYTDLEFAARQGCQLCQALVKFRRIENEILRNLLPPPDPHDQLVLTVSREEFQLTEEKSRSIVTQMSFCSDDGTACIMLVFWSISNEPILDSVLGRRTSSSAKTRECFDLARQWLQQCGAPGSSSPLHEHCTWRTPSPLPTRVISVGRGKSPALLHNTDRQYGEWVALSHRWGDAEVPRTTKANLEQYLAELPLDRFSQTFKDAIWITKELGFDFLWVDSLCIIQDSDEDWTREAANMSSIYKNAAITISASHGNAPEEGILAQRRLRWTDAHSIDDNVKIEFLHGQHDTITCYARARFTSAITMIETVDPLRERGWILQESALSPRTINWTQEQMIWHCCSCFLEESVKEPVRLNGINERPYRPGFQLVLSNQPHKNYTLWMHLVEDFCKRDLTVPDDVLPAMSALAEEFAILQNDTYLAGLWQKDLHRGLLWNYKTTSKRQSKGFCLPSWSWAAHEFPIHTIQEEGPYQFLVNTEVALTNSENVNLKLVIAEVRPWGLAMNTYGRLEQASLHVRAWISPLNPNLIILGNHSPEGLKTEETEANGLDYHGIGDTIFHGNHNWTGKQRFMSDD